MSAFRSYVDGRPVWVRETDPEDALTPYQRQVMHLLRSHRWNRSRVARQMGVSVQTIQVAIRSIRTRGIDVPEGARRGRDLGPRSRAA
jgi:biotin operon repressor